MGAIGAIMKYGSEPQKRLAAGLVLAGDKPAICITEPGAGSATRGSGPPMRSPTSSASPFPGAPHLVRPPGFRYAVGGSMPWAVGLIDGGGFRSAAHLRQIGSAPHIDAPKSGRNPRGFHTAV
jgi:hypothetical protein